MIRYCIVNLTIMIKYALTTLLILSSLIASSRCDYTVKLYDHGHDGWEGNSLVVRINNVNVADITLTNGGGPYIYTITAQPNDVISLLFRRNGSHFTECRYESVSYTHLTLPTICSV